MNAAPVSLYKPGSQKAFKMGGFGSVFGASTAKLGTGFKYELDNGLHLVLTLFLKELEDQLPVS